MRNGSLALLALVAGGTPVALPAQGRLLDSGTLVITSGTDVIGREEFEVRAGRASGAQTGFTLSSTALYPPAYPELRLTAVIEFAADSQPLAGRFDELGTEPRRTLFRLGRERVTIRRVTQAGESAREYPGAAAFAVLHDSLFGYHAFAPPAGREMLSVSNGEGRGQTVRAVDHGLAATSLDGREEVLRHFTVRWNGRTRHLWYDSEGRFVKLEDAERGLTVARVDEARQE